MNWQQQYDRQQYDQQQYGQQQQYDQQQQYGQQYGGYGHKPGLKEIMTMHLYTPMEPETQDYIKDNVQYYMPKFWEMKTSKKNTSWNFASFFLTAYWLIYRKMYAYGFIYLGACALCGIIPFIGSVLSIILGIGGAVLGGIYGNYIYMMEVEKRISQERAMPDMYKSAHRAKKSGTNIVVPLCLAGGVFLLFFILFIVIMAVGLMVM